MNKKISRLSLVFCLILLSSLNLYAQESEVESSIPAYNVRETIPEDLMTVLQNIPTEYKEIDNIRIRLLKAKIDPKNATKCIEALPAFCQTDTYKNMPFLERTRRIMCFTRCFEDIFSPVKREIYLKVCHKLKQYNCHHSTVYYLMDMILSSVSSSGIDDIIPEIINLLPIEKDGNALIISSLYTRLGEKTCFDIIDQLKEKYASNTEFIDEINFAKQTIILNKNRKRNNSKNFY